MQNLEYLLENSVGQTMALRYVEIIDIMVDIYGENMSQIEDLVMSECERYEPSQAIHALNSMLLDVIEKFFLNLGVTFEEESFEEANLMVFFDIFEAAVRVDGYELYDELLALIDLYNENDAVNDLEELFVSILRRVHKFDEERLLTLLDEVDETYFEIIEEELRFAKKQYENSFELDASELLVFKVHPLLRDLLRSVKVESVVLDAIKAKQLPENPCTDEFKMQLAAMPLQEASKHLLAMGLLFNPDEQDPKVILDFTVSIIAKTIGKLGDHMQLSFAVKALLKNLKDIS